MKIAGVGDQVDAAEIVLDVQGREIEFVVAAAIFRAALAEHAVLAIRNPLIEGIVVAQVSFLVLDRWRDQQVVGRLEGQRAAEHRRFAAIRTEEPTSELQSLMRISYALFCLN